MSDKKPAGKKKPVSRKKKDAVSEPAPENMESFAFSVENTSKIREILERYPHDRQESAVMPLLDLAQRQCGGWLPRVAMDHVAEILDMAAIRVYEVATFYTMFNLKPVGRHHILVCTTTPCWLRGSDNIVSTCKRSLGINLGETTPDGLFTLGEVECLGACSNAPVAKINDEYFEDLGEAPVEAILTLLKRGDTPHPGSQSSRFGAAPANGLTTLTNVPVRNIEGIKGKGRVSKAAGKSEKKDAK